MPVDNELYNRSGDSWWDEKEPLSTLRTMLNPARFGYFRKVLVERLQIDPKGAVTLDVGCGGGLLAEEFARLGCRVTGVDPSEPSLATARAHAARSGLVIDYRPGVGEALPFEDQSFDIVYCCDVLEHVADVDRTIEEIARVLRPGGVFLYDTVNRTLLTKLIAIKLAQEWRATRFLPPHLHDWNRFIRPEELRAVLERHGLEPNDPVGLKPALRPLALLRNFLRYRFGTISVGELGRRMQFRWSSDLSGSYAGYAISRAPRRLSVPARVGQATGSPPRVLRAP
jgi:2-polyprenyl-6-hydroxyphenyl methylase/3-demethylubiquinone-9 3-methyltransferase